MESQRRCVLPSDSEFGPSVSIPVCSGVEPGTRRAADSNNLNNCGKSGNRHTRYVFRASGGSLWIPLDDVGWVGTDGYRYVCSRAASVLWRFAFGVVSRRDGKECL